MGKHRRKGFSLIETLVCIGILMVLASVALMSYQGAVDMQDLKRAVPAILDDIQMCEKISKEMNSIVTIRFILGKPELQVCIGNEKDPATSYTKNYSDRGILKRKFTFREYKWPDGNSSPATFTFFPETQAEGGVVKFGSGFAEAKIFLQQNRACSDI